jgi:hypothetical protein
VGVEMTGESGDGEQADVGVPASEVLEAVKRR